MNAYLVAWRNDASYGLKSTIITASTQKSAIEVAKKYVEHAQAGYVTSNYLAVLLKENV